MKRKITLSKERIVRCSRVCEQRNGLTFMHCVILVLVGVAFTCAVCAPVIVTITLGVNCI